MTFVPGDRVHLAGVGTGTIREERGGGRFAIAIKGRIVIAAAADLESADPSSKREKRRAARDGGQAPHPAEPERTRSHMAAPGRGPALDLHGKTVADALAAVEAFVNDMLLAGHAEIRVIHGRSGGRVKAAVHQHLRQLSVVASFRLDPHNAGVTIVAFA
jgi:DNA mismatch repair protein MutS2